MSLLLYTVDVCIAIEWFITESRPYSVMHPILDVHIIIIYYLSIILIKTRHFIVLSSTSTFL